MSEEKFIDPVKGKSTYTCPIHKNVRFDEPGKCPECLRVETKKKLFEKNPDDYVRTDALILAAKLDDQGRMMCVVNHKSSNRDLHYGIGELNHMYRQVLDFKAMIANQKKESPIIKPKKGVAPFRNIKKG